ncbi:MAG: DNA translocase FtsK 4TM domain-containing protein, partial [Syntrophales bacterium]
MKLDDRKVREIWGAIFLAGAIFFLLCLASYHPLDPSFTHFVTDNAKTHNLVGSAGSHIADSLIRLLGIGAFIIPFFLLIISFRYFLDEPFKINLVGVAGLAGLIFSTSALLATSLGDVQVYGVRLSAGGLLGALSAELLNNYMNQAGTYIILLLVLVISLIIIVNLSLVSASRRCKSIIIFLWDGLKRFTSEKTDMLKERKEQAAETERSQKLVPVIDAVSPSVERMKRKRAEQTHFDFLQKEGDFKLPPLTLLDQVERKDTRIKRESLIMNSRILEKKLADFGVEGKVVEVKPGPLITMYELEPAPGVKITKVTNLSDDLALAL